MNISRDDRLEQAARWLVRSQDKNFTCQDKKLMAAWLEENPANRGAFEEMGGVWEHMGVLGHVFGPEKEYKRPEIFVRHRKAEKFTGLKTLLSWFSGSSKKVAIACAAMTALVFLCLPVLKTYFFEQTDTIHEYKTTIGEQKNSDLKRRFCPEDECKKCPLHTKKEKSEMKSGKTKTGFWAGIFVLLLVAGPAMAEQKKANLINMSQTFNIEAGFLEEALDNYSKVTGIKTVYLNELVAGKESLGVQGIYSSEAAVQKILKGTGLTYTVTGQRTVVLKENKKQARMVVAQRVVEKREEAEEKEEVKRPVEIEQMVVTAQKREENVQDVPASITALSKVQIEDAGIESTSEIHTFIPNFTSFKMGVSGFSYYSIRGQSNFIQATRSVGIYIDDVPSSSAMNTTDSTIYDIERMRCSGVLRETSME